VPVGACVPAPPKNGECIIYLADDLEAIGLTREMVLRHEMGHCNGWSGAHERQRSVREAAEADAKEAFPKLAHAIELRKSEFKKVASLRSPPRQIPPPWVPLVMLARLVFFTFGAY
jgi:hypothetical protein